MAEAVSVRLQELQLPTYILGAESPYPTFRWAGRGIYPYSLRTDIGLKSRPGRHRAVVLENRYVRVTVLPDLGGKIFSFLDKTAGQDAFMVPPSIKYQDISPRGAWIAGGIELNFGCPGHTAHTTSPVTWSMQKHDDGSASVWVGSVIRPIEERYAVRISLKPDRISLDLDIHTMGPQSNRGIMYWWTNTAVQVGPESRFYYYGNWATPGFNRHSWPVVDGKDYRWLRNRPTAGDTFLQDVKRDYMAFYDFSRDHGVVNTADRVLAPGQKYFTWGNDQQGRYWDLMLSDSEQTYVEVQRGRLPTQMHTEPIPAMSDDSWSESWIPLNDTQGFSGAGKELIVAVDADESGRKTTMNLLAISPLKKVRVQAYSGQSLVSQWTVESMTPSEPVQREIATKKGQAIDRIIAADAAGRTVLDWREFHFKDEDWTADPENFDERGASLEQLFLRAETMRFYNWPQPDDASARLYEKVFAQDPGHTGALQAQAEIAMFNAQFAAAEEKLRLALKRKANDATLHAMLGWALFHQAKLAEAQDEFRYASRYQPGRRDGLVGLASAHIKAGEFEQALAALDALLADQPREKWARALRVIALRKSGQTAEAKKLLKEMLAEDPLWSRLSGEALALGIPSGLGGGRKLADDAVTAALPYIEMNLWQEAENILQADESNEDFSPAIRLSHLAYAQHQQGKLAAARATLKKCQAATTAQATPWAMTSLAVLEKMVELYPDHSMLRLLYGTILASRGLNDEAAAQWHKAVALGMNDTVVHFDLAAHYAHKGDHASGLKHYRKSWELSGNNIFSYMGFDGYLARLGKRDERDKLYNSLPAEMKERPAVRSRHVNMLLNHSRYDEALEQLTRHEFVMAEFEKTIRLYYLEALVAVACRQFAAGDLAAAEATIRRGFEYPRNLNTGRSDLCPDEVMLHYVLGLIAEAGGDAEAAKGHWTKASMEETFDGSVSLGFQMLANLALGNRARAMNAAHRIEKLARGEDSLPEAIRWWVPNAAIQLNWGFGQLAKGRIDDARSIWKKSFEKYPDARWYRVMLDVPLSILAKMARKGS